MSNFVFLSAKGRFVEKASLPLGTDDLIIVLLKASGLEADSTMKNCATLAAVLSNSTEVTFTNYARKSYTSGSITITPNTGTGVVTVDLTDAVFNAAGGASNDTLGALIVAYRPTSGSADSAILPLTKHDFSGSTTGGTLTATIPSIGTAQ